jgi:protein O-mannosyl-transferase
VRNRSGQWQEVEPNPTGQIIIRRIQKCQAFLRKKKTNFVRTQKSRTKSTMSRSLLIALLLALTTLLVYLPVTHNGFLDYDDDDYVTNNQIVQNGLTFNGIQWAFTTFHASNWHPLTWFSHMTDCQLFGLNPGAHHFVNVLFHAANAALLFVLLFRLTGALWPAAFIAALFAWHPLHVESVAWIAERKDVLSTFFALLSLLSYATFARENCRRSYWFALIFFALGLMAKPMLVTLPFVLLLLDFWPIQRFNDSTIQRLLVEKIPFFMLTAISCLVTFFAQRNGDAIVSLKNVSLPYRLENLFVAYAGYLQKIFWPENLAVVYPLPETNSALAVTAAGAVLFFVSAAAWWGRKRAPYLAVGWLWFLGMLVPVIGLVQVGGAALADRYTYLPATGVFVAVTFGALALTERLQFPKMILGAAAVLVLGTCLIFTEKQLRYWHDSKTLFIRTLAVTKNNDIAHVNLGVAFEQENKPEAALVEYRAAAKLAPTRFQIHNNLGNLLDNLGQPDAALVEYREAIRLNPKAPSLHDSLGIVLVELGNFNEAMEEFTNAARLDPVYPWPHFQMAKALLKQGRDAEAIDQFHAALRLDPENYQILAYLAHVLAAGENPQLREGKTALELAIKANTLTGGGQPFVLDVLGMAYAKTGDFTNAIDVTQKALDLANAANLKKIKPIQQRLELYKNHQPWRESFLATNVPVNIKP